MLAEVQLIAEPWDCGPGGYQVGGFPPGWAEWNDTFRDTARDYWRGMAEREGARAASLRLARQVQFPRAEALGSVNFVSAHDGFTLGDLVFYNDKHNEANGDENRDGHSDNRSWNCGVEGPTILSQGTPMIRAGDEFGRAQSGNNNAYCQDNEISWVDWQMDEDFQKEPAFLGVESSPAFVRAPEELRQALLEFRETYNASWLIGRHGFISPADYRRQQLQQTAKAA